MRTKTESLTEYAERKAAEAQKRANELVRQAPDDMDPMTFNQILAEVTKNEIEAQRWLDLA